MHTPKPFNILMFGPQGPYQLAFNAYSEWDGYLDVTISGIEMRWSVEAVYEEEGETSLEGGTDAGTLSLWGNMFWFRLFPWSEDPRIEFWGDQVICRVDKAAAKLASS